MTTYSSYIDGRGAYSAHNIKYLKELIQFEFDYCNAFSALIVKGAQAYAYKKHDGDWERVSGPADKFLQRV